MASTSNPNKRKHDPTGPISPPVLKRQVQSTTTPNAVASFFTPTSSKPPEKIVWSERGPDDDAPATLLVGKYIPASDSEQGEAVIGELRKKVAAFDFDSTLISTASGKKFASDAQDWKWWHSSVPGIIRKLYLEDGFRVVIVSNQGGIALKPDSKSKAPKAISTSKVASFKTKVTAVLNQLDIPISFYAATAKDIYRKPRTGIWTEILDDYDIHTPGDLDLERYVFVGDAGGRVARGNNQKDFSCSDRNFAENVGITFFTPEEYFLHEEPREFTRSFDPSDYLDLHAADAPQLYYKSNDQEIVLFCGSPGAGKSTFYWKQLQPLGFQRINQDILKSRDKCLKVAGEFLGDGKSVAVDNTNADFEVRGRWVELAAKHSVPIRCVLFTASTEICEHNDAVRALNEAMNPEKRLLLPGLAFKGFASRYQRPVLSEGFQDITEVAFKFQGTEAEREIWRRHWT